MINVAVGGATGRLGCMVCGMIAGSEDMKLVGALVSPHGNSIGREWHGVTAHGPCDLEKVLKDADVYVDLTSPDAASGIVTRVPAAGVNMIIGTTSIPDNIIRKVKEAVSENGTSALVSANFAAGVNVFWKTCGMLAAALRDYDIEIIEKHHSRKKDAPSGTAAETVRRIISASETGAAAGRREVRVHSVRAGDFVGDHTVIFAGGMETIELTHSVVSREAFAKGCIESVKWIYGKKDGKVHEMSEVFGL